MDWMNEEEEEYLLEKYNIRPGETRYKISISDWLLYSLKELSIILDKKWLVKEIEKVRVRIKYGVKEELLGLLRLKNIGRVRARKMYNSGLKTLKDVKNADMSKLKNIIGEKMALNIKKQLVGNTTNYLSKT
jgi:helicase